MVAFQFPPFAMSSGVQRTLRFVQHLPALGWQPIVLSAHPRAFAATSADLLKEIPPGTVVERAFALDAARHLSIAGRYPGFLARPDRWRAWAPAAIRAGMRLIRQHRPDIIWSTYPIATAHLIAHRLHRLTGIPLVADFRDPMAQEGYPEDPRTRLAFQRIEHDLARDAARLVFVTPSARAMYQERFPDVAADRFVLIENGFDEESFAAAESGLEYTPLNAGRFTLLHSGIVYPSERDPTALFAALGRMRSDGRISADILRIRFRAPVEEELLRRLAAQSNTGDIVEILPAIPYRDALREMLRADGLMVMQASNCNEQIPAKLYEYLRARRPILGLADPIGDTARTLRASGVVHVARLEDSQRVEEAMTAYLAAMRSTAPPAPTGDLSAMSRRARARELATLLENVSSESRRLERGRHPHLGDSFSTHIRHASGLDKTSDASSPTMHSAHRPPLSWKFHRADEWSRISATWDEVNGGAGRLPFLESAFIEPLLRNFGSGDELVAFARRGDRPVAAALLRRAGTAQVTTFQPSQLPLGPWLVVEGEDSAAAAHSLLAHMPGLVLGLGLTQLDPRVQARPAQAARQDTIDYIETGWVDVAGTFDAYWEARGKNLRTNMRKQRSKLEADGTALVFDTLTDAAEVPAAIAEYGHLETAGWKAGMGTAVHPDNPQGRFYEAMLRNFCALGRGRIWRLKFGDKVVAMDLCIEAGDTMVVLKTAFDPEYRNVSPAFLMRQDAFRQVFDEGRLRRIEFYGRMMEWHTRWTEQSRTLYHANIYRWAFIPRLRRQWHRVTARRQPQTPAMATASSASSS